MIFGILQDDRINFSTLDGHSPGLIPGRNLADMIAIIASLVLLDGK
jgi:hypothetical protein